MTTIHGNRLYGKGDIRNRISKEKCFKYVMNHVAAEYR